MEFSVVIPAHNRKSQLERAIQSVLAQTWAPAQIIVVDDGSAEDLAALEGIHPTLEVISIEHAGVSAARNAGIAASRCEWIAFLDSDDEWLPLKLQQQAEWLQTHPDCSIVHCDEIWLRNAVRVNARQRHKKSGGWIFDRCLSLCVISPSSVVLHQNVFRDVGVFDERLLVCEDYDLWLRITHRYEVGYVDQPLVVKYGGHSDQLSRKYAAMDRFRIEALVKLLKTQNLSGLYRRLTIAELNRKIRIYVKGAVKRDRFDEAARYQALAAKFSDEIDA